jgi:hypothetical protein
MSHLLYFRSFSPEKFQRYFELPTVETISLLHDSVKEYTRNDTIDMKDFQQIINHIEKNGLTYQGLKHNEITRLDEVIKYCLFGYNNEEERMRFDMDIQYETSGGLAYDHFEYLLKRSSVDSSQNKNYPMIKICTETRRYKEKETVEDSDDGYEGYMIFNSGELIQLQNEVESILKNNINTQQRNEKSILECISEDLLSPVKKAIQENRWLYGHWT